VRGRLAAPRIGIFERGTHWVVDIPQCLVHHPTINDVAAALRGAITESRTTPYNEKTGRGLVRYLQVVVGRAGGAAQVVVIANAERASALDELWRALVGRLGATLQGLFFSPQTSRGNAILTERCELVHGDAMLVEDIVGARVCLPPDAFVQSNLHAYAQAVQRIGEHVPDGSDVVELYAGVGAIGLSLLPRVARVRFNEVASGSLAGLDASLALLDASTRSRTEVHAGSVAEHAALARDADCLIVDPPRKGLDPTLRKALCEAPPRRLVYLSCDEGTLERDIAELLAAGMHVRALDAYDFFPFTGHVETLALLER
jgi:tRNA/tmRNA/rRNA uracil-C5-methylase (TrmA/RlmC/RlmD family)